jgi:hypothetical protein
MCGECCKRYLIPVYSADIRRIADFTRLEPKEFLELIIPDESVACTYDGVPRISLDGERGKVLVLKEEDDVCMFLKDKKCAVYTVRPLRCRPFPEMWKNVEVFRVSIRSVGGTWSSLFSRPRLSGGVQVFIPHLLPRGARTHGKRLAA